MQYANRIAGWQYYGTPQKSLSVTWTHTFSPTLFNELMVSVRRQSQQAETQARAVGVRAASMEQPVRALSGGNQQKVALCRLLHQDASVFLLDEPTRGVDIGSKAQIYEAIAAAAARGKAVLFVSSYLPELLGLCDRLAVMSRGRLGEARPVAEWTPAAVMEEAIGA